METVIIVNKRNKKQIQKMENEGWLGLDVSTRSTHPVGKKFSPNYPHGNIPIPGRTDTSLQVSNVWEGLKTFKDGTGIDASAFRSKCAVLRGKRKFGDVASFKMGDSDIVDECQARLQIYVPTYEYTLENCLRAEMSMMLQQLIEGKKVMLIDTCVGEDVGSKEMRFSHAAIIKVWLLRAASMNPDFVQRTAKLSILPVQQPQS